MPFSSLEILTALKALDLLHNAPPLWWPGAGSFEVVIGAILTQNTRFELAQQSLENLKTLGILSPDTQATLTHLANSKPSDLAPHIAPSGFYNQKAHRLVLLSQNILRDFGGFESFKAQVDRAWLLEQKGLGKESADAILNYACLHPILVVDKYTYQLLLSLGMDIPEYDDLQAFLMQGLQDRLEQTLALYEHQLDLASIYARFHGKIVACMRAKIHLKPYLEGKPWFLLMPATKNKLPTPLFGWCAKRGVIWANTARCASKLKIF